MKTSVKFYLILMMVVASISLVTCQNPTGDEESGEMGTFTINLGGNERAVGYPPTSEINNIKFVVTFKQGATVTGPFTADGTYTMTEKIPIGIYDTVEVEVFDKTDGNSVLAVGGLTSGGPITIHTGNNAIYVTLYKTVKVTPDSPTVGKGSTTTFTASVYNDSGATVTWSVAAVSGTLSGTTISSTGPLTGLLTVPAGETADAIWVTAIYSSDTTWRGSTKVDALNTIYIVDSGDDNITSFLWGNLTGAVTALQNGYILDISGATPEVSNRTLALGSKSVTVKGDTGKTYPLAIITDTDLILEDFKGSLTGATNGIQITTGSTASTITALGNCSIVSSGGDGIVTDGSLTINGSGILSVKGNTRGIDLTGSALTIDADVTVEGSSAGSTGSVYLNNATTTISGTGNLNIINNAGSGNGIYIFPANATLNINGLGSFSISSAGNGIFFGNSTGSHSLNTNLPTATTITGGVASIGHGICIGAGLVGNTGTHTITNNGAPLTFMCANSTNFGIWCNGAGLTLNGTGDINSKGNLGIYIGEGNTLTVNTNVTVEGTGDGGVRFNNAATITGNGSLNAIGTGSCNGIYFYAAGDLTLDGNVAVSAEGGTTGKAIFLIGTSRVIFSTVTHQLTAKNNNTAAETIPCTNTGGALNWLVTGDGIVSPSVSSPAVSVTVSAGGTAVIKLEP